VAHEEDLGPFAGVEAGVDVAVAVFLRLGEGGGLFQEDLGRLLLKAG
jgi:hypothetical protein